MLLTLSIPDLFFHVSLVFLVCVKCDDLNLHRPDSSLEGNTNVNTGIKVDDEIRSGKDGKLSITTDNKKGFGPSVSNDHKAHVSNHMNIFNNTLNASVASDLQKVAKDSKSSISEIPLEGGGKIALEPSINKSTNVQEGDEIFLDETPNKGSKGRKGVTYPSSSVVARKGVTTMEDVKLIQPNSTLVESPVPGVHQNFLSKKIEATSLGKLNSTPSDQTQNKDQVSQYEQNSIIKTVHSKKPEFVSDEKDADYSEKYSLIHTSTTGEDYVIIGIVLVIGIWFSVFGALVFYRRAGEYWDRRHYRRMDFLVEGMYND